MSDFVKRKEVLKTLGIHFNTLQCMIKRGDIEYIIVGKQRHYNVKKYLEDNDMSKKIKKDNVKKIIGYCRVSSKKQSEDLDRQINDLKSEIPNCEIITDIGSGLNFNRNGLKKIIDLAIEGKIEKVYIEYKDRLARFGFDMIERIVEKYSGGKIIVLKKEEDDSILNEITRDILSIMNIYVAKINGMRKYKRIEKKIRESINLLDE